MDDNTAEQEMTIQVHIPTPLRGFTDEKAKVAVVGATAGEVLQELLRTFNELTPHLLDNSGDLRSFVNIYVNDDDIRHLNGQDTILNNGDVVSIVPSIAGGSLSNRIG